MRQFSRFQMVPPPMVPQARVHHFRHEPNTHNDWKEVHKKYIRQWRHKRHNLVPHDMPFDITRWNEYMAWFNRDGMRTVWRRPSTATGMCNPAPAIQLGYPLNQTFVMQGERVQQTVSILFYLNWC